MVLALNVHAVGENSSILIQGKHNFMDGLIEDPDWVASIDLS